MDKQHKASEISRKARRIALAGNPNVGKSTVFNRLTGLKQHTGNWAGKTVVNAQGEYRYDGHDYIITDLPGCYSLYPQSAEEEVAREYICSGVSDVVVVVCSASCLERSLNLAVQIMQVVPRVVICVNLLDEAKKKGVRVNLELLEKQLGVPVIGTCARSGEGFDELLNTIAQAACWQGEQFPCCVSYPPYIESAIRWIMPDAGGRTEREKRRIAAELLMAEEGEEAEACSQALRRRVREAKARISARGISAEQLAEDISSASVRTTAGICRGAVSGNTSGYGETDRRIDRLLTGRATAPIFTLLLLVVVFWLTISGTNLISGVLRDFFGWAEGMLDRFFLYISSPEWLRGLLVSGVFRILGWVVSVMLPPMAIFFPLFTILEDIGYLPRLAFNMDHSFKRCGACGKQALTMCMGFGCNAAGITGCRIIDSPRERLIALLTNSLVPCNGRFPLIASIISMFLVTGLSGAASSFTSALLMALAVGVGIAATFAASWLLSHTILRGVPSSFMLELPPFRRPQWGKVILRSVLDRTVFVLGRAVVSAVPAGALIWLMGNIHAGGESLLTLCSSALDAPGRLLGMDGAVLLAFILGFPANEIVIPLILMIYSSGGVLTDAGSLPQLSAVLTENGWTWVTGVCVILFSIMHWPCATSCITVYKETRSLRWTAAAIILPTAFGIVCCAAVNALAALFFEL